jgi:MFS family permease
MKSAFNSYWFWILLLGLLLILIGALIAGGTKEFSGWVWGLFITGIIIAIIGIILGIVEWNKTESYINILPCPKIVGIEENTSCNRNYSQPIISSYQHYPTFQNSQNFVQNSPQFSPQLNSIQTSSPLSTPTKVTTNIPQAQRGFSTTSLNLSALSPNS